MEINLYEKFSGYTNLPIKIDWVAEQVCEDCNIDILHYISVKVDHNYLLGMHRLFNKGDNENNQTKTLHIYYNSILDLDAYSALKRIVVCKEILHTYDNEKHTAKSMKSVEQLIEGIIVPPALGMSSSLLSDHNGALHALMVLLPRDALDELIPAHLDNKYSVEDVARLAGIPEEYARLGLSSIWKDIVEQI